MAIFYPLKTLQYSQTLEMFFTDRFLQINSQGHLIKLRIYCAKTDIILVNDQVIQEILAALFNTIKKYIVAKKETEDSAERLLSSSIWFPDF